MWASTGWSWRTGCPPQAVVAINRAEGFVYDLVSGRQVAARRQGGRLLLDVDLGPCDGGLWMVSPKAIDRVRVQAPETIARGDRARCRIEVLDADGRPLAGGRAATGGNPRLGEPRGRTERILRGRERFARDSAGYRRERSDGHMADRGPGTGLRPYGRPFVPRPRSPPLATGVPVAAQRVA